MGKRRAIRFGVVGSVVLPWLASCGLWAGGPGVSVKIDPQVIGTRAPKSRTAYSCYLVNVYGPGISPTVSGNAIGYYAPDCLKLGVSSAMVSGTTLTKGVRFSLPAGAKRTIQVLGIVTSLGASCEDSDLSKLFLNDGKPELYELATRELDLFRDAKVTFEASHLVANPVNLLASCSSTKTDYNPANLTAVQIVTRNNTPTGTFQNFTISSAGVLAKVQDVDLAEYPDQALATRDNSRAVYWSSSTGFATHYAMALPGILAVGPAILSAAQEFRYKVRAGFSENGQMMFLAPGQTSVTQMTYSSTLSPYDPPVVGGFADISFFWVWDNAFHLLSLEGSYLKSYTGLFATNTPGFGGDVVLTPSGLSFFDSAVGGVAVRGNSGIYAVIYETSTSGYNVGYYARRGLSLASSGNSFPVTSGTSSAPVRLALDPTGKILFVKYEVTGNFFIKSYLLKTDGTISAQSTLDYPIYDFQDMVVDHRGKYLVIGTSNGASGLRTCPILENGLLGLCISYASSVSQNLRGVQSFPIF